MLNNRKKIIAIPKQESDVFLTKAFSSFKNRLIDLDLKISVGPIVQFRQKKYISACLQSKEQVPLLISRDIQNSNNVIFGERENHPKRSTHNKAINLECSLLIPNSKYILIRKILALDDKEYLVSAIYDNSKFNYSKIGLDNNLLYIHKINKYENIPEPLCSGLYCYINSNQFANFYSLINGTHTINISDFETIGFPSRVALDTIGKLLLKKNNFNKTTCSDIVKKILKL